MTLTPARRRRLLVVPVLALAIAALPGCVIVGLIGAMAESAEHTGSTTYPADYEGLDNHSYAVVVSVDRVVEADNPGITARLTQLIDESLSANTRSTAHIPAGRMLAKLYAEPSWRALPRGELGEKLGVDRLVFIEVVEYRLHEPGNRYIWDGLASGLVEVYEIDSALPDDPMYGATISVSFPDRKGLLEEEIPGAAVTSELSRRFAERVSWLFYEHTEPNAITY